MSAPVIKKGDTVETLDLRVKPPKAVTRKVVGFIHGKRGGVLKVLYIVDGNLPAQTTTPTIWNVWKQEEARRNGAVKKPVAAYRRLPVVAPIADDAASPAFTETRDVLMKAVQRVCRCKRVFLTRVVSQWDCPGCTARARAKSLAAKVRAEGGAA